MSNKSVKKLNLFHELNKDQDYRHMLFRDSSSEPSTKSKFLAKFELGRLKLNREIEKIDIHTSPELEEFRAGNLYAAYEVSIRNNRFAQAADIFRIYALNKWGGTYNDTDDQPTIPLASEIKPTFGILTTNRLHAGNGIYKYNNTPIMSMPGHPVLELMIDRMSRIPLDKLYSNDPYEILELTGPSQFTRAIETVYPFMMKSENYRAQSSIPRGGISDELLRNALNAVRKDITQAGQFCVIGNERSWLPRK